MNPTLAEVADGVRNPVPVERMDPWARRLREVYALRPGAPLLRDEFWLMEPTLEKWREQGLPAGVDLRQHFRLDPIAKHSLGQLGWCEAAFCPQFPPEIIEDRGEHEVVRDSAGRHVLCFKGRRTGFMPEYLDHPVKDQRTWEKDVKWRLAPDAPGRFDSLGERMERARADAAKGWMICQNLVGGYMYLRSLIGPEDLLYFFYDEPELLHDCLRTWFELADAVIARHQEHVTLDEIFLAEDICYNHGPLISPDMIREFLFPYYQQLLTNARGRQLDQNRHLYLQIDTDGNAGPVIEVYRELGMEVMSPFEVASGCDVVEIGQRHPWLVMRGGIDKRVLAKSKRAIDEHVERILPTMRARGGYIPTVDHGTPPEVPLENYLHYRRRCEELGG